MKASSPTCSETSPGDGWAYLAGMPNTDAKALSNKLRTIQANISFDKLQAMREASPTGGALSQVQHL